jgi:hypothetical protein
MSGVPGFRARFWIGPLALSLSLLVIASPAEAGGGRKVVVRRGPVVVVPAAQVVRIQPRHVAPLGTFTETPNLWVRGSGTTGGGYSPLGFYGTQNMVMYGPTSSFRSISAPVLTYTRGYDGRTIAVPGTSFSSPNLPALSPVVYPTQANDYFGFRVSGDPPWWQNASDWIDQN